MARTFDDWHSTVAKGIRKPALIGIALLAVFGGGFGVWAGTAPLASGVVARGLFVATGQNKIIQHLEGGIVREIRIKEGDTVEAGQPLVMLDDTATKSEVGRLSVKQLSLRATLARLEAEQTDSPEMRLPPDLEGHAAGSEEQRIIGAQQALFQAKRHEIDAERQTRARTIDSIRQEIVGLQAQRRSTEEQLALTNQEATNAETLLAQGLMQMPRYLQLKRTIAKLSGDVGYFVSEAGKAEQRILEQESELAHSRTKRIEEAVDQYRAAFSEFADTEQRLSAARDILRRTTITAPVRGIIVKLEHHTPGGVIGSGQKVLEILPLDDRLLVEAHIRPDDIDSVHAGLEAEINLSALDHRTTPMVLGKVVYVSADKIEGQQPQQGEYYYVARVEIADEELAKLGGKKLFPGMPAEVFVKTGERTFAEYMMKPLLDIARRGGREG
jgi:HlyD family secretion protein